VIYTFAELELDTRPFQLRRSITDEVIAMEPQVFDTLCFSARRARLVRARRRHSASTRGAGRHD
jgi:hypothetical protein